MITYTNLTGFSYSFLKKTFNEAFSDYNIPMNLSEEQIKIHLESNDYNPRLSIGAFDNDKMVGFVFVGQRGNRLYDGGTAVIKEYRRKGIAKNMIKSILNKMQKDEVFILECISDNTRGLKLYESLGFVKSRHFICYKLNEGGLLSDEVKRGDEAIISKDYRPSWQNEKIVDPIYYVHGENKICVRKDGGVYFSDPDYTLINHALKDLGRLSFTNVNNNDKLTIILKELGATIIAEQEEMVYESN
ncbi:GNAT family N-acetyltransferase [Bullifex sp.]|uniref:GNAT family N-acetyltransferase n=1 Tax=Bullifex sp. TaxID=2815808 RepID=UPI002A7FCBC4|nr:GNAT family N-acetyltransferase [Bullifex sp.]MDY4067729.1 GNAT family N-acetyltransferase [Bullifex sp.]